MIKDHPVPVAPVAAPFPAAHSLPNGVVEGEAALPAAQPVVAEVPETDLDKFNPDMVRRYPFRFTAYVLATMAALGVMIFAAVEGQGFWTVLAGLLLAACLWRLLAFWLRMKHTTITLTTKRLLIETGALRRQSTEIQRQHIVDLQVHQSLLNRMLGVGDLIITTDNGARRQTVLMAVREPGALVDRIRATAVKAEA